MRWVQHFLKTWTVIREIRVKMQTVKREGQCRTRQRRARRRQICPAGFMYFMRGSLPKRPKKVKTAEKV